MKTAALALCLSAGSAHGQTATVEQGPLTLEVDVRGGYASLVSVSGEASGVVEIPGKVGYQGAEYDVITLKARCMSGLGRVTGVTVGDNDIMLTVGDEAFAGCPLLYRVDLPACTAEIYVSSFSGCTGLREVVCRSSSVPELQSGSSGSGFGGATLYVPAGSLSSYERAMSSSNSDMKAFWGSFAECRPLDELPSDPEWPAIPGEGGGGEEGGEALYEIETDGSLYGIRSFRDKEYAGRLEIPVAIEHGGLPREISYIAGGCFEGCGGITEIAIHAAEGVDAYTLRPGSLRGCDGLLRLELPPAFPTVDMSTLADAPQLKAVVCAVAPEEAMISNFSSVHVSRVALYVPEEHVADYDRLNSSGGGYDGGFGRVMAIGDGENAVLSYEGVELELVHLMAGHRILYSGCEVAPGDGSLYEASGGEVTVLKPGRVDIAAYKASGSSDGSAGQVSAGGGAPGHVRIGAAAFTLPELAAGHRMLLRTPSRYKVEGIGCSIEPGEEPGSYTVTATEPESFALSAAYSGTSSAAEASWGAVRVTAADGAIRVEGLRQGQTASVADMRGRTLTIAGDGEARLAPGVYIVTTPGGTVKVSL